ncbi:sialate O-acetylesterase [Tardiphaga sp. 619_E2_N8_5]|uniref:sialate O-acetylesterase n=1 Tax=unclassified Tardiphaga TaxID=2631404 RepID=UPI003F28B79D
MSIVAFSAVMKGATALPDKYDLGGSDSHGNTGNGAYANNGNYPGYRNTNGRTQVDATLVGGQKTLVIIVIGQSNACSVSSTPYTPSNSLAHNLNIYDGGVYRMKDPPLGCSQTPVTGSPPAGAWMGRLADKLINASVAARVIMVPAAMAGSYIGDHDPAGTQPNNYIRLKVALLRCAALGLTPDAVIWMQGEGDNVAGTSQANYTAALNRIIAQSRTDGYSGPWFVNKTTWNAGAASATIQAAQDAVINHGTGIWAGANTDSLNNTNRQDLCHFTDAAMDSVASLMLTALQAYGAPFV